MRQGACSDSIRKHYKQNQSKSKTGKASGTRAPLGDNIREGEVLREVLGNLRPCGAPRSSAFRVADLDHATP